MATHIIYTADGLEKIGEVVTNHSISFDDALDLLGAERIEIENPWDADLRIDGKEYWSDDLCVELEDEYIDALIRAGRANECSTEDIETFVRNAGSWDEPGVQGCMQILATHAGHTLWEMYRDGNSDDVDVAMTFAEDILGWIREERSDDWDWDEKVWEASELLEDLAKDRSPYESSDMSSIYEGWPSIARYIQTLLDVDLGI